MLDLASGVVLRVTIEYDWTDSVPKVNRTDFVNEVVSSELGSVLDNDPDDSICSDRCRSGPRM